MRAIDIGARCEAHVGEVYPPRCAECAAAASVSPLAGILATHHWDCVAGLHKLDAAGWCVLCGGRANA
ncbi:hypothetical protein B7R21_09870 [Subtercola boreus]|uniref:Uncharacterized protein n=1 Tax=Subtercola boreus TaxID=120213 RepID=A0A3E0VRL7_9MICO|nr:hypothetical protein B7R21_09870 [Subtercola boreus]